MASANLVQLDFLHAFGAEGHSPIQSSVCLSDDDTNNLIYPVGRHIAVRNLETNDINFIREPEKVTKITAMAISPEKTRRFLAVAEYIHSEKTPLVSVFDLKVEAYFKRKRQLGFQNIPSKEFIFLRFSQGAKLLAALSSTPECFALVWDWNRDKLICKYSFGCVVSQLTFNPKDTSTFCTTGPGHPKPKHTQHNDLPKHVSG